MLTNTFWMETEDDAKVWVDSWFPDDFDATKGAVLIVHGMAEHAERYEEFAMFLVENHYAVYALHLRGHGKTAGNLEETGFIAGENKFWSITADIYSLYHAIYVSYFDKKIFYFGHSMGSFLLRGYLDMCEHPLSGLILSGTAWQPYNLLRFGEIVAKMQCFFKGEKHRSKLLDKLSFGAFNKRFKPNRTPFDWLSRDAEICQKYTDDPYCGFVCTTSFFRELFNGMKYIHCDDLYEKIRKDFPILIFSGTNDPVGNFGKGPTTMFDYFKKRDFTNVTLKLYPEGRHEMLNETNRSEVFQDVVDWLDAVEYLIEF